MNIIGILNARQLDYLRAWINSIILFFFLALGIGFLVDLFDATRCDPTGLTPDRPLPSATIALKNGKIAYENSRSSTSEHSI